MFRRPRNFFLCLFTSLRQPARLPAVVQRLDQHVGLSMQQAIETISRRSMKRECLVNTVATIGLLAAGGLLVLAMQSFVLWFFARYLWMW
jgi:hypothetical protein